MKCKYFLGESWNLLDFDGFVGCVGLGGADATVHSDENEEDDKSEDARDEGH